MLIFTFPFPSPYTLDSLSMAFSNTLIFTWVRTVYVMWGKIWDVLLLISLMKTGQSIGELVIRAEKATPTYHVILIKESHLYWKNQDHLYFRNALRIFIDMKEVSYRSFPATAGPAHQTLTFPEQINTKDWIMAPELLLESQVSWTFKLFSNCLCLLPMSHTSRCSEEC